MEGTLTRHQLVVDDQRKWWESLKVVQVDEMASRCLGAAG